MDSWLQKLRNLIKWDKSYILPSITREKLNFRLSNVSFFTEKNEKTNDYLYKIGISLTDIWTFLNKTRIAWSTFSGNVNSFWQKIQLWFRLEHQIKAQDFSLTLPTCLGLVDSTEDILQHHALLIGRYYIYSLKIKKSLLNLQVFSQTFLKCQEIEKCYAYKTNTVKKYKSKWNRFKWAVTL